MVQERRTIELDANEVALIVGEEEASMTVRVVAGTEIEGEAEVTEPYEIAVALAMRLLEDPDFHDDVLEWYESRDDIDDEEGDEEGEEEADDDEPEKAPGGGTPPKPAI